MIELKKLIKGIKYSKINGSLDRFITNIQYDSRKIEEDNAFIAIKGFSVDGHIYIQDAYKRGARVFFLEDEFELPNATSVLIKDTRKSLPEIARIFYEYPEKKLKIVGITGTNGKTTTAYLLHSILSTAHWKPGIITTIQTYNGRDWIDSERTTPESLDIMKLFREMANHGRKSVVMEVSSHALSLHRVDGISFIAGIFTNLGRDHLDFHGTEEEYFLAKRKLFEGFDENQKVVINLDDYRSSSIIGHTEGEIFSYTMKNCKATVNYISHQSYKNSMKVKFEIPSGEIEFSTTLLGSFNIYNLLAASTTAVSLGLNENFIVEGIENCQNIPGRCEYFSTPDGFTIYIDYAHSPDALRNILFAVGETSPSRLIVVFGAGGNRDKGKRPHMGKVAEDFAEIIYLTNDNPRSENPELIINDILSGILNTNSVIVIPDRKEAIMAALSKAEKGDSVVIAGKGHEKYQEIKNRKEPFDDHDVVKNFFEMKNWAWKN
jgi:UDP-N-acetylmuramoyl-L-alanyl-D-glutamate--2,6-diaminopimelate ligase